MTESPRFGMLLRVELTPQEVGRRIKEAREAKGWTHADLREAISAKVGQEIDIRTVQRWQKGAHPKTGKSWLPRPGRLKQLAEVLEVPTDRLVELAQPADDAALGHRLRVLETVQAQNTEMLAELLRLARGEQSPPRAKPE